MDVSVTVAIFLKLLFLLVLVFYLGHRNGQGTYVCKRCHQKRRVDHE